MYIHANIAKKFFDFKGKNAGSLKVNRFAAIALLQSNECRHSKDPMLHAKYADFMNEYLNLKHMQRTTSNLTTPGYYLPHHGIFKSSDPEGKLRVVFNASFKTKSGFSSNDCLLAGPRLQSDLWMVLTRWRFFRVAFTTDIVKMFRQILIDEQDAIWQRILWRDDSSKAIQDFKLDTVTYGTASVPYLALRVLLQLASDESHTYPNAANFIRDHSYVDDLFAGADSLKDAQLAKHELIELLAAGGFPLSKWASNNAQLCPESSMECKTF